MNASELIEVNGGSNPIWRWLGDMVLGEIVTTLVKADASPVHSGSTYAPYPGVSVKVK